MVAPDGWYWVAEAADLAPGTLLPLGYLGRRLLAWRTADGGVRVADAGCPHQGAHLAGRGGGLIGGELVCPVHRWRFDPGTGRCTGVAGSALVPAVGLRLHSVAEVDGVLRIRRGAAAGPAPAPDPRLAGLRPVAVRRWVGEGGLAAWRRGLETALAEGRPAPLRADCTPIDATRLAITARLYGPPGMAGGDAVLADFAAAAARNIAAAGMLSG